MNGRWGTPTETTHSIHHWCRDENGKVLGYVVECKQYPVEYYAVVGDSMLGRNQSLCVSLEYAKKFVEEGGLKMFAAEPATDESSGEVPPPSTWPAWGPPTGDEWRCAVVLESAPEPATDPYEMEAE